MPAAVPVDQKERVIPDARVSVQTRALLLERGEAAGAKRLGVTRQVALRAAAQLPHTEGDEIAIRARLRELSVTPTAAVRVAAAQAIRSRSSAASHGLRLAADALGVPPAALLSASIGEPVAAEHLAIIALLLRER